MKRLETRDLLAENTTSRIEICDRGILHVHSGPTTLHLSYEQCKELATSLAIAMVKLTSDLPERETTGPRLVYTSKST